MLLKYCNKNIGVFYKIADFITSICLFTYLTDITQLTKNADIIHTYKGKKWNSCCGAVLTETTGHCTKMGV